VKRDLWRAARALALPALALAFVVAFAPGRTGLAIRVFALLASAAALLLVLAALRRAYPRARPLRRAGKREAPGRAIPGMLGRLEQETILGVAGSFDLHYRLRPRLRALAGQLLAARRGVSLDTAPERARELLGETTWELVRRDRPPPQDRLAAGVSAGDLHRVVESLEGL